MASIASEVTDKETALQLEHSEQSVAVAVAVPVPLAVSLTVVASESEAVLAHSSALASA